MLLRSTFCWEWEDVLFFVTNARSNKVKVSPELGENLKKWNSFDSKIFDHFNATFWTKINDYPDFDADLNTLKVKLGL